MNQDVLRTIEEVDELIHKAQIVRGGNSERREWAGSSWEDQDIPDYAPNGTDYNPSKNVKRVTNRQKFNKAVSDMSTEELEQALAMRKAGLPNPVAAEAEILETVPGVSKAICPECTGASIVTDGIRKSTCGRCQGFGFCFVVPRGNHEVAAAQIDAIAKKYNVGADPDYFEKAQRKNKGGGRGDSDTTPAGGDEIIGMEEDFSGEMVAMKGQMDQMAGELEKMKKMHKANGDMEEEDDDEETEINVNLGMDKSLMSESLITIMDAQQSILKGLGMLMRHQNSLEKGLRFSLGGQADIASLVADSVELTGAMFKSMLPQSGGDMNKSMRNGVHSPARAPRATGNLHILQKGFVDQAPGLNDGPRFDLATLKKGASQMCLDNRLEKSKRLHRRVVIGLENNVLPEENVLKAIESYIEKYGIED